MRFSKVRVFYNSEDGGAAVAEPKKAPKPKASPKVGPKLAKGTENGKAHKAPKAKSEAKPASKKSLEGAANPGQYGINRDHDLPWNDKKVAVFKALKSLKAVGKTNAVSAKSVAEKIGDDFDATPAKAAAAVRHYCYHAKAAGLIDAEEGVEGIKGYAFYLTQKGAAVDPVKAHKEQEATKAVAKPKAAKEAKAVKKAPKAKKPIMETVEE